MFVEEEREREQEARINKAIEAEARAEQLLALMSPSSTSSHGNRPDGEEGEGVDGSSGSVLTSQRGGVSNGGGSAVVTFATAASIKVNAYCVSYV